MVNIIIFSIFALVYVALVLFIFIYKGRTYLWISFSAFFLFLLPLLIFDLMFGSIKYVEGVFESQTLFLLSIRAVIEEVSRISVLVILTRHMDSIGKFLVPLKVANIISVLENTSLLMALYTASAAWFYYGGLSMNYSDSDPILRAFDEEAMPVFGIVALSIMQFTKVIIHTLLGYIGMIAWHNKKIHIILYVVMIHVMLNVVINLILTSTGLIETSPGDVFTITMLIFIFQLFVVALCFWMAKGHLSHLWKDYQNKRLNDHEHSALDKTIQSGITEWSDE